MTALDGPTPKPCETCRAPLTPRGYVRRRCVEHNGRAVCGECRIPAPGPSKRGLDYCRRCGRELKATDYTARRALRVGTRHLCMGCVTLERTESEASGIYYCNACDGSLTVEQVLAGEAVVIDAALLCRRCATRMPDPAGRERAGLPPPHPVGMAPAAAPAASALASTETMASEPAVARNSGSPAPALASSLASASSSAPVPVSPAAAGQQATAGQPRAATASSPADATASSPADGAGLSPAGMIADEIATEPEVEAIDPAATSPTASPGPGGPGQPVPDAARSMSPSLDARYVQPALGARRALGSEPGNGTAHKPGAVAAVVPRRRLARFEASAGVNAAAIAAPVALRSDLRVMVGVMGVMILVLCGIVVYLVVDRRPSSDTAGALTQEVVDNLKRLHERAEAQDRAFKNLERDFEVLDLKLQLLAAGRPAGAASVPAGANQPATPDGQPGASVSQPRTPPPANQPAATPPSNQPSATPPANAGTPGANRPLPTPPLPAPPDPLREALGSTAVQVRLAAVLDVYEQRRRDLSGELLRLAEQDTVTPIRYLAIKVLRRLEAIEAIPGLARLAATPVAPEQVRTNARAALDALKGLVPAPGSPSPPSRSPFGSSERPASERPSDVPAHRDPEPSHG